MAVFAFCAEMTRLPSHWLVRSAPVNATAQTTPLRSTMVPHMWLPSSPFCSAVAADSAAFRLSHDGSAWQPLGDVLLGPCA